MRRGFFLKKFLKLFATIFLLIILFRKINIEDFGNAIRTVKKDCLFISIFTYIISVGLNAAKWKLLLPNVTFMQLNKTCFKAQFYSMVLPGQLFGEASKVLDLKNSGEVQGRIASSVIVDKITSLIGTMVIGIVGMIFTSIRVPMVLRILFVAILFILFIIIMSGKLNFMNRVVTRCSYFLWKSPSTPAIRKTGGKLYKLYAIWITYSGIGIVLFQSVFVGIINQMLGVFQVWVIADSIGINVSFVEFCWIMPTVSVILLLPISFGGLGVREISLTGFLALFKVASEKAITISVISLLSHFVSAIIGALAMMHDEIKRAK